MRIYDGRSDEEIMTDQAVEIRELIPKVVNGICTDSMVCSPIEVFGFAKLYIEELQAENKKLKLENELLIKAVEQDQEVKDRYVSEIEKCEAKIKSITENKNQ